MLSGYLVVNRETQVQEFLTRRSIMDIKAEHRALTELDLTHLEIIDVDKFIYIYYASADSEIAFRTDLNIYRQLLESPFFHADESVFILVGAETANIDDLIRAAARDGKDKTQLRIIHHSGQLQLNDVLRYLVGSVFGNEVTTLYKDVFIREADKEERERFEPKGGDVREIIPSLTDTYTSYHQKVKVEAGRIISESNELPHIVDDFSPVNLPKEKTFDTFLITGDMFSMYHLAVGFLATYFESCGKRTLIVDARNEPLFTLSVPDSKKLHWSEIFSKVSTVESTVIVDIRYEQFGLAVENFVNFSDYSQLIVLTDSIDQFEHLREFVVPFSNEVISTFVTHYTKECLEGFIKSGIEVTSLMLNPSFLHDNVDVQEYKDKLSKFAVSCFPTEDLDPVDFYNCTTGRWE